jgi:hypothetical protein
MDEQTNVEVQSPTEGDEIDSESEVINRTIRLAIYSCAVAQAMMKCDLTEP